jgi:NitT/TauT family transport system ATP-binding protein
VERAALHAVVQTGGKRPMNAVVGSLGGRASAADPTSAAAGRGAISLRGVGIHFGSGASAVEAVRGIDLEIAGGEFVSLLGPSGCGKSTLVGAIAGFTPLSTGELRVDQRPIKGPGPDRGVVFQQATLFPWKTVLDNVAFGLKMRGIAKAERHRTARELLEQVGLGEFLGHYPEQLSGGMQQRVSLARVLVQRPRVLLLDEPFCSLDAQTRLGMQELLLALWQQLRMTVLFVTHDVDEAVFLSDRVLVSSRRPGRIQAALGIDLPRPRRAELLTSPEFMRLKREAMGLLGALSSPGTPDARGTGLGLTEPRPPLEPRATAAASSEPSPEPARAALPADIAHLDLGALAEL